MARASCVLGPLSARSQLQDRTHLAAPLDPEVALLGEEPDRLRQPTQHLMNLQAVLVGTDLDQRGEALSDIAPPQPEQHVPATFCGS